MPATKDVRQKYNNYRDVIAKALANGPLTTDEIVAKTRLSREVTLIAIRTGGRMKVFKRVGNKFANSANQPTNGPPNSKLVSIPLDMIPERTAPTTKRIKTERAVTDAMSRYQLAMALIATVRDILKEP